MNLVAHVLVRPAAVGSHLAHERAALPVARHCLTDFGINYRGLSRTTARFLPLRGKTWRNAAMDGFGIGARMRAARALANISSAPELAAKIDARGLKRTKLYAIEKDRQAAERHELQAIADACGVPLEWFTADFSRLAEISADPKVVIAHEKAMINERRNVFRGTSLVEPEPHAAVPGERSQERSRRATPKRRRGGGAGR
ncbi:MAG: helix-turn-helix transcriptional regulator [Patescibacteria group bacterium]|nr:helix-turn-helix transcriptional regulator [Patescibacteria group bacterium]